MFAAKAARGDHLRGARRLPRRPPSATVAGVAAWGFHGLRTLSDTLVSAPKALLLVFAATRVYLIPLIAVDSIGVLLSTVTRNSAAAIVGTIGDHDRAR